MNRLIFFGIVLAATAIAGTMAFKCHVGNSLATVETPCSSGVCQKYDTVAGATYSCAATSNGATEGCTKSGSGASETTLCYCKTELCNGVGVNVPAVGIAAILAASFVIMKLSI